MSRASKFLQTMHEYDELPKKHLVDREAKLDVETPQAPTTPTGNMPDDKKAMGGKVIDTKRVKMEMNHRLKMLGIEGIQIEDAEFDKNGCISVTYSDEHSEHVTAAFCNEPDAEDGVRTYIEAGDLKINIGSNGPSMVTTAFGKYLNMYELDWLDKSTMMSILNAGGLSAGEGTAKAVTNHDAFGNRLLVPPKV